MNHGYLIAGAAALALAACGPSREETMTEDVDGSDLAGEPSGELRSASAEGAMPADAQQFTNMTAANDIFEIEAGKLAQQMGKSQAVKDFGAMMERDHTKSTADLKAAAGQAEGVAVNAQMSAKQRSDLETLKNAGERFDETYVRQQVAAHEQAAAMLRGYAQNGDAGPLKQFAAKTAPIVEGHLAEARQLR